MNIFRKKYNLEELCWMITDELPEEVRLELEQRAMFWAPEAFWDIFTQFIEEYIRKDSKDVRSVKIYALLYGKTEKQIQKIFRKKDI